MFVDGHSNINVVYRKIINDSIRDIVHSVSVDMGKTFSPAKRISADNFVTYGCPESGPSMTENKVGLQFTWYSKGGIFYNYSKDSGKTFSPRDSVSHNWSAKHAQIATLDNGNIIIAWDESVKKGGKYINRIGIQERDPDGKIKDQFHINSKNNVIIQFPVIMPISDTHVFIAYTQTKERKNRVFYRVFPANRKTSL